MTISQIQKRNLQINYTKLLQYDDNIPTHKNRKKTTKRYAFSCFFLIFANKKSRLKPLPLQDRWHLAKNMKKTTKKQLNLPDLPNNVLLSFRNGIASIEEVVTRNGDCLKHYSTNWKACAAKRDAVLSA